MAEQSPRTRLRRALRRLPRWSVPAGVAVLCAVAVPCGGYLDVTGPMDTVRMEEGGALARGHSRLAAVTPSRTDPAVQLLRLWVQFPVPGADRLDQVIPAQLIGALNAFLACPFAQLRHLHAAQLGLAQIGSVRALVARYELSLGRLTAATGLSLLLAAATGLSLLLAAATGLSLLLAATTGLLLAPGASHLLTTLAVPGADLPDQVVPAHAVDALDPFLTSQFDQLPHLHAAQLGLAQIRSVGALVTWYEFSLGHTDPLPRVTDTYPLVGRPLLPDVPVPLPCLRTSGAA
jgi:hypothetical protein